MLKSRRSGSGRLNLITNSFVFNFSTLDLIARLIITTTKLANANSKSKNNWQDYWKTLSYEKWVDEFGGQKKILSKYAAIPLEDVKGARAPNLQTAGNVTIAVSA